MTGSIDPADLLGTSYQGTLSNLSFNTMAFVFDRPNAQPDGYETTAEWHVKTPHGHVAIFNVRPVGPDFYSDDSRPPIYTYTDWIVFAYNTLSFQWIQRHIEAVLDMRRRYSEERPL